MNMSENARRAHARVLQALQDPGKGAALAVVLGVSDSTVSRLKTDHLEHALAMVCALGFKLVPDGAVVVDATAYKFLTECHAHVMQVAPHLIWRAPE